jgi:hypothetical protein
LSEINNTHGNTITVYILIIIIGIAAVIYTAINF